MPLDEGKKIDVIKRYLRRNKTLVELQSIADTVWNEATDTVTITTTNIEGANASGQITLEKLTYLAALEELIAELDTSLTIDKPARSIGVQARWSDRSTRL